MFNTFDHQQSLDLINLAGSVPHDSSWPGRDAGPVHPASPSITQHYNVMSCIFHHIWHKPSRYLQPVGPAVPAHWDEQDHLSRMPVVSATLRPNPRKKVFRLQPPSACSWGNSSAAGVETTHAFAWIECPGFACYENELLCTANLPFTFTLHSHCTIGKLLLSHGRFKSRQNPIRSSWIILHHPFREFRFQHSLSKTTQTFPASCSVEAVSASEGATPVTFSVFAFEFSAFGGCHSSAASRPRRKIATKLSSWMMAQRGAPQIMGSNEPAAAYQGVEIKAMPTIKATKTSLGSLEVAITVPASFRGLIVASKEGIQRKMGNCKTCENVTVDGRNSDPEEQEKELCKRSHCFWRRYVPCRGADLCHIQFRSLTSARCHQTHQAHHQKVHKDRDVHWWDIAIQGIPCDGQNHQRDQTCQNSGANWSFRHLQIQAEAKGRQQLHQHAILENDDDTHLVVTQEHAQQKRQAAHKHWIQFSNLHHIFLRHGWAKSFLEDVQRNNAGGSHQCTIRSGHDGS